VSPHRVNGRGLASNEVLTMESVSRRPKRTGKSRAGILRTVKCPACLTTFTTTDSRKNICSRSCHKRWAAVFRIRYTNCAICQILFTAHSQRNTAKVCSAQCRKEQTRISNRRTWAKNYEKTAKPLARKHSALRRARQLQLQTEDFTHEEIFLRDQYRCHLCGCKIDARLKNPHPRSAELDHLVPVSLGGDHTRANVAAAHRVCNQSKSNRPQLAGEQLRLVG
jgi:hypothetical protein